MNYEYMQPEMTIKEIEFLDSMLSCCRGSYFEFGAGGSTFHACMYPLITHITSVESSQFWIQKLMSNRLINISHQFNRLQFLFQDINSDDNHHSWPKDQSKKDNWPLYSRAINQSGQKYNMVLIDGRFRVACALHTLDAITPKSYVMIHDYANRPQYHCVEQFYDKMSSVENLSVFCKKSNYDTKLLETMIKKYEYICD